MNGWMGKLLRVNLTNETLKTEPLNMNEAKFYAGGRGLGLRLYMNEVDPKVDALGPDNKLIIMTGPLTGTLAAYSGMYAAVSKSPLTGAIGAYSSGGHFGPELKFAGYDGIIIEGKAKKPLYLYINDDRFELRDASNIWGKDVPQATEEVKKETDEDAKVACIGTSGEKLVLFATIMNDNSKTSGRSGFGAVMGSKNLKAIAVRGTRSIKVANQKEFMDACIKSRNIIKLNPVTGAGETETAENALMDYGAQPSTSWQAIKGRALSEKYLLNNKGCFGCTAGCGRVMMIERPHLTGFTEEPQYETDWPFGSDCDLNSLSAACEANLLCNRLRIPANESKVKALKTFQDLTAVADSVGICLFSTFAIGLSEIAEMFRTCTGLDCTDKEVLQIGERIWNLEKIYNLKNGFSKKDDTLLPRLINEPVKKEQETGQISTFDAMFPEYYSLRGWDKEGVPTAAKRKELGLVHI